MVSPWSSWRARSDRVKESAEIPEGTLLRSVLTRNVPEERRSSKRGEKKSSRNRKRRELTDADIAAVEDSGAGALEDEHHVDPELDRALAAPDRFEAIRAGEAKARASQKAVLPAPRVSRSVRAVRTFEERRSVQALRTASSRTLRQPSLR